MHIIGLFITPFLLFAGMHVWNLVVSGDASIRDDGRWF